MASRIAARRNPFSRHAMRVTLPVVSVVATLLAIGCSSRESSNGTLARDSSGSSASASSDGAGTPSASTADTIVRGIVATVSDSLLVLKAPAGDIRLALAQPVHVYERR